MTSLRNIPPLDPSIEDEILIIETSGEMPEVAYHGSIYYLTKDPDGPRLSLKDHEDKLLKLAVTEGFRRIIIRDLSLHNRQKSIYRGLERSVVNWKRLNIFCGRAGLSCENIKNEIRQALKEFLVGEINDVLQQGQESCLNCSAATVKEFLQDIGLREDELPPGWRQVIC